MPILTTRSSVQAATKILEKAFTNRASKVPPLYPKLFNEITTDPKRSFASFMPYAELGTLVQKPEGQAARFDRPFEMIPSTFNYNTYALAAAITEEGQTEDVIGWMGKIPGMLSDGEQVTKDLLYWNILNFAFSNSVLGADGQPLCSPYHPLGPRSTPTGIVSMIGQTFSNSLGASQLTPETLQQAYILFETMLSDRGLPSRKTPVYLVVGTALAKVAEEILASPYQPNTSSNTVNVIAKTVQLMVSRYLVSPTAWFVTAAPGDVEGDAHSMFVAHKWQNRASSWMDPATKNLNMQTSFRSTFGWLGWRGVVGSLGA